MYYEQQIRIKRRKVESASIHNETTTSEYFINTLQKKKPRQNQTHHKAFEHPLTNQTHRKTFPNR